MQWSDSNKVLATKSVHQSSCSKAIATKLLLRNHIKKVLPMKTLQRSHCSEAIVKKAGETEYAKNVCEFLLQQDWYSADNSGNMVLGNEKSSPVFGVSKSISEHSFITR